MLHYMYGPVARERLELEHLEREKREREIRELRERELNDRLKEELLKGAPRPMPGPVEPHWLELHRRYAAAGLPPGHSAAPPQAMHQFGLYGAPGPSQLERERLERLGNASYGVSVFLFFVYPCFTCTYLSIHSGFYFFFFIYTSVYLSFIYLFFRVVVQPCCL